MHSDHDAVRSRRGFLRVCLGGAFGVSVTGYFGDDARAAAAGQDKAMILLWMNGGPSQIDTFDPKPDHQNGGDFKAISTSVAGIQVCEHLPQVAKQMKHLAIVRSMQTKEGSHERARYLLHTGYLPTGSVTHPSLGSIVSKELGEEKPALPNFVSVTLPSIGPGFLGMSHAAFHVPDAKAKVPDATPAEGISAGRFKRRLSMLDGLETEFIRSRRGSEAVDHREVYEKSVRLMQAPELRAFDLEREKDAVRDAYGRTEFGQGCLLARRLVEAGVKCVEVTLNGWDTHINNFGGHKDLLETLDPAMATLVGDLVDRGLLEKTLVVWMGEFGRTPRVNFLGGRDHFPRAWSAVLGGAGIHGGKVVGKTSASGEEVGERPVSVPDLFASFATALGIDPAKDYYAPNGRPIPLVNKGKPVGELFAG